MSGATLTNIKAYVDAMMHQKKITTYEVDVSENSFSGDGYVGDISFIQVNATIGQNEKKYYNLVIKSAKNNDEFREKTPVRLEFEREILMYTEVFPALHQFQINKNVTNPCNNWAKCYSVCLEDKKEAIILQNLKSLGYELHDRMRAQNLDHALVVFQNYAKLHSVTLAMRHREPEFFQNLTKDMSDVMAEVMEQGDLIKAFQKSFRDAIDVLKSRFGLDSSIVRKFNGFDDKEVERVLMRLKEPDSPQSAVNHSDCWNSNMMFKYEDSNKTKPTDMKFVDFQLSTVASPVCDLSHYLYSCTDKAALQHFDLLLETYHSTLVESLKGLGCDSDKIFTLEGLKDHWKKFGRFGLAMSTFLIKMQLRDSSEVLDFANAKDLDYENMFNERIKNHSLYEQRIIDVFTHFAELFL